MKHKKSQGKQVPPKGGAGKPQASPAIKPAVRPAPGAATQSPPKR